MELHKIAQAKYVFFIFNFKFQKISLKLWFKPTFDDCKVIFTDVE